MKIRLIKDRRRSWAWLSVLIPTLNASILGSWVALPERLQEALPVPLVIAVALVLLVLGILGRFIDQGGADNGGNNANNQDAQ